MKLIQFEFLNMCKLNAVQKNKKNEEIERARKENEKQNNLIIFDSTDKQPAYRITLSLNV